MAAGGHEWIGQLLSALFSTERRRALLAGAEALLGNHFMGVSLYWLLPLSVFFGRAFMPEALILLLSEEALLASASSADTGIWSDCLLAVLAARSASSSSIHALPGPSLGRPGLGSGASPAGRCHGCTLTMVAKLPLENPPDAMEEAVSQAVKDRACLKASIARRRVSTRFTMGGVAIGLKPGFHRFRYSCSGSNRRAWRSGLNILK